MKKTRCIFCMQEMDSAQERCPSCGRALWQYHWEKRWLRPYARLKERYVIGRVLGEGAFGVVYLAYDEEKGERAAIKEYLRGDPSWECEILERTKSIPGIVRKKDFFQEEKRSYLVMEYVEGDSLKEYEKKKHAIQPREAEKLLIPVLKGLSVLHSVGIVHGDISPDNLLFDGNGQLVLIDFGAALSQGEKKAKKELKEGYAPMEQYQEKEKVGPWTDLYALCGVWYEMVTGHKVPPAPERVKKDTLRPPSFYVKVPPQSEEAFLRGLSVDIQRRYFGADNLLEKLSDGNAEEFLVCDPERENRTARMREIWGGLWIQITTEVERDFQAGIQKGRIRRIVWTTAGIMLGAAMVTGLTVLGIRGYEKAYPEKVLSWKLNRDRAAASKLERKILLDRESQEFQDAVDFLEENAYEKEVDDEWGETTYRLSSESLENWEYFGGSESNLAVFPIKSETIKEAADLTLGDEGRGSSRSFSGTVYLYQEKRYHPMSCYLQWTEECYYGKDHLTWRWEYTTGFVQQMEYQTYEEGRAKLFLHEMLPMVSPESYLTEKEIQKLFEFMKADDNHTVDIDLNAKCSLYLYQGEEQEISVWMTAR